MPTSGMQGGFFERGNEDVFCFDMKFFEPKQFSGMDFSVEIVSRVCEFLYSGAWPRRSPDAAPGPGILSLKKILRRGFLTRLACNPTLPPPRHFVQPPGGGLTRTLIYFSLSASIHPPPTVSNLPPETRTFFFSR